LVPPHPFSDGLLEVVDVDANTDGPKGDANADGPTGDANADGPTFESLDWEEYETSGWVVTRRTVASVASLVLLAAAYGYDYLFVPNAHTLVFGFRPHPLDWLSLLSVLVVIFWAVVPLALNPRLAAHYWRRFRRNRLAVAGLAYLVVFVGIATLGPELWGDPIRAPDGIEIATRGGTPPGLPPFWGEVAETRPLYCGTEVVDGMCQGTIVHPLGTTPDGQDVLAFVFEGMAIALKVALITSAIIVPLATVVGTVAAYYGGRVEGVLMRYVDLQQAIPGFIVYLLVQYIYGPSLLAIVVLFGLFDWGRIARRVHSDAIRHRDAGFVVAALDAGAPPSEVVRRHVVPNVANTVIAGLAVQVPFIVVVEVALEYIGVSTGEGWGWAIKLGLNSTTAVPTAGEAGWAWWSYAFPLLALLVTVVSMAVVGDAVHDAVEPRERGPDR
jgi:peptide/nickel transport system permease protein